jgi:SAM-dependent methyltransferase
MAPQIVMTARLPASALGATLRTAKSLHHIQVGWGRRNAVAGGTTAVLGIDTSVPSTARMYDFWLGGHDNFAVDRAAALEVSEAAPEAQLMAVENRKFLRRAVRYLAADAGITQFLDIGTGLPTQGNVHQVAQDVNSDARVVYVDNDPMVLAHCRALKTGGNNVVIEADVRNPRAILDHPSTQRLIDFSQPLAVLLVAVLHFISDDDDPRKVVAALRDAIPPGSYLVLSHVSGDIRRESAANAAVHYKKVTSGATLRGREEILRFFAGLELIDPGVVQVPYWRPDEPAAADADKVWILGGIGRKPGSPQSSAGEATR